MLYTLDALNSAIIAIKHVKNRLNTPFIGENMRQKIINALYKAVQA
jgi:hypothetical protein